MNTKDKAVFLRTRDFLVSGESFDLIYDESFDLLKTSPFPQNLDSYYESDSYISHTDEKRGLLNFLYQKVKKYALRKKMDFIENKFSGKGTLLDIGAGTGDFLNEAKKRGWEVQGTEPNSGARKNAESKSIILSEDITDLEGKFDVITLWHVLEHIPDLEKIIDKLSELLKEGGFLIIAVPNYKSYDAAYYGKYWAAYDVPRHLWHFSQKSIGKLFSPNFRLDAVKPMIFDSYYVSLLSEKYKSEKKFSIKAFFIGWKSNWRARKSKQYSSLIYCLKPEKKPIKEAF